MDFETLIYLAAIFIYFIINLASKKKKQQAKSRQVPAPLPNQPRPALSEEEQALQDALSEIRVLLGGGKPEEIPVPPPVTIPAPSLPPKPPAPKKKKVQAAPPPDEFQAYPTQFADETFETQPTVFGAGPTIHKKTPTVQPAPVVVPLTPTLLPPKKPKKAVVSALGKEIQPMLKDKKTLKKAFVLSEILSPPRALRHHR